MGRGKSNYIRMLGEGHVEFGPILKQFSMDSYRKVPLSKGEKRS